MYKSTKIEIDLDKLQEALDYIKFVNSSDLSDIIWVQGGTFASSSEEDVKEWKFVGLNNSTFAVMQGLVHDR